MVMRLRGGRGPGCGDYSPERYEDVLFPDHQAQRLEEERRQRRLEEERRLEQEREEIKRMDIERVAAARASVHVVVSCFARFIDVKELNTIVPELFVHGLAENVGLSQTVAYQMAEVLHSNPHHPIPHADAPLIKAHIER